MQYPHMLRPAKFLRRYKRFMVDVEKPNGEVITLHCPNTGSMKNCLYPGEKIWYSDSKNPKRKYPCTWEQAEVPISFCGKTEFARVSVNTGTANLLVGEYLLAQKIAELKKYSTVKREVCFGRERSRVDFFLTEKGQADCYVEVKSVTLAQDDGLGIFPDAVTKRGIKHLRELITMKQSGHRAVLFFCVQHTGIDKVKPADSIDPEYGRLLREAARQGVEVMAWGAKMSEEDIVLNRPLPVIL